MPGRKDSDAVQSTECTLGSAKLRKQRQNVDARIGWQPWRHERLYDISPGNGFYGSTQAACGFWRWYVDPSVSLLKKVPLFFNKGEA